MTPGLFVLFLSSIPFDLGLEDIKVARDYYNQGLSLRENPTKAVALFKQAAASFEKCEGHVSASPVYFREWAAAELLAGKSVHSLLVCRKGLRLFSCDPQLLKIRAWIEQDLTLKSPERLDVFAGSGSKNFFMAVGVFNLLGWLLVFLGHGNSRRMGILLVCGCLILAFLMLEKSNSSKGNNMLAIVSEKSVLLKTGDGYSYPDHVGPPLKQGTELKVIENHDDWFLVETTSGKIGWIGRKDILIDWGNY